MNNEKLETLLNDFSATADNWFKDTPVVQKHFDFFKRFFQKENLEALTWEQVQQMGDHLHAANALAITKKSAFGQPNHDIEHYQNVFMFLKFGDGTPESRIREVSENPKYKIREFGPAIMSELFGYLFPEVFTFKNSRSDRATEILEISSQKKRGSKWIDEFLDYNKSIEEVRTKYEKIVGKRTALPLNLEIDQFFSWLYKTKSKLSDVVDYWTIAPGEGAFLWDDWQKNNLVAIGWDDLGSLDSYETKSDLGLEFKKTYKRKDSENPKNDILACWDFANTLKPNDIVFVKKGVKKILAMGKIVGTYTFDQTRDSYKHTRQVEWLRIGEWDIDDRASVKALTQITQYPTFVENLKATVSGIPKVASTDRSYWWLNANPKMWNPQDKSPGETQTYTSYGENGNKRRVYKYFEEVKVGDWILGYLTSPHRQIVSLFEITKGLHESGEKEIIEFKKLFDLQTPISSEELKNHSELKNCEPLINNQGSLFKVTPEEFSFIQDLWTDEEAKHAAVYAEKYSFKELTEEIFAPDQQLRTMLQVLDRKKNIILQGPPGTGKTYLAKRLAYAAIGAKDEDVIEMVQFHQSYAYEDFIQGYRPNGAGGFTLKSGIFYRFCREAMRFPNKRFFFLIDEINRGNLSKIFGELMLLVESDKRGKDFAIPLTYSENDSDRFYIPENVYLIGTMNTADRSLSVVDYALRRRFSFFDLQPEFESSKFIKHLESKEIDPQTIKDIVAKMTALNSEIRADRKNLGPGFTIGHSFFCSPSGDEGVWYKQVVENDIATLLREYWYDDEERVEQEIIRLGA